MIVFAKFVFLIFDHVIKFSICYILKTIIFNNLEEIFYKWRGLSPLHLLKKLTKEVILIPYITEI